MHTKDFASVYSEKLAQFFPECVTEISDGDNGVKKAIDIDRLKQLMSTDVVEGETERYQFTWPDKKKSIRIANAPSNMTLRPCREESVDFDSTENLYIEGDNLEVLKLLREDYLGKVKMIYIDPPYNTGNDFIYSDDYSQDLAEYVENSGQLDDQGNRLVQNTDGNGRFHTDWLNMLYPRIRVAKDLLSKDGVIFISIGQNEIENTIKIGNEIFGKNNQLGIISRQMKSGGGSQGKYFAHNIDYIVIYAKEYDTARYFRGEMSEELVKKVYNQIETEGPRKGEYYRSMGLYQSSLGVRPSLRYYIQCPDGHFVIPPGETFPNEKKEGILVMPVSTDGVWRWSYDLYKKELEKGNIEFKKSTNGVLLDELGNPSPWNIYTKIWLKDRQDEGTIPNDLITKYENRHSSKELSSLDIPFDFAKPVGLIHYLIQILNQEKDITILDFFSGSATTAHAVMKINSEDGGTRKFIMVQLPELTDPKTEAHKAGFKNICEIGKERIRRAGKKILEEQEKTESNGSLFTLSESKPKVDVGFRVLKLDSSNMQDVYYRPEESSETTLFEDNIKPDRTPEDLLFQVMLECNLPLSAKIVTMKIAGKDVFYVNNGYLMACFDVDINEEVIREVAKMKPYYFILRDSSLSSDNVADNFDQIFQAYSKETIRRVL